MLWKDLQKTIQQHYSTATCLSDEKQRQLTFYIGSSSILFKHEKGKGDVYRLRFYNEKDLPFDKETFVATMVSIFQQEKMDVLIECNDRFVTTGPSSKQLSSLYRHLASYTLSYDTSCYYIPRFHTLGYKYNVSFYAKPEPRVDIRLSVSKNKRPTSSFVTSLYGENDIDEFFTGLKQEEEVLQQFSDNMKEKIMAFDENTRFLAQKHENIYVFGTLLEMRCMRFDTTSRIKTHFDGEVAIHSNWNEAFDWLEFYLLRRVKGLRLLHMFEPVS